MVKNFELDVIERLARIEQDIKPLSGIAEAVNSTGTAIEVLKNKVVDHDRRISGIEGWGKWLVGAVGMLIVAALWQGLMV